MKIPRSCLRITAYHMRRRVARALDPEPGPRRRLVAGRAIARLDELALRGDLTRGRVDEEDAPRPAEDRPRLSRGRWRERARAASTPTCAAAARPRSTRRAYGVDLGQFALWASAQGLEPAGGRRRATLRRYAARAVGPARRSPPPSARKLAALRALLPRAARARPRRARTPPTCARRPSARATLPQVLRPDEVARAARPHPRLDAARAARPRAVRARLRVRPARRGARQPRRRLASTSTPSSCASRARARKTRFVPGRRARAAGGRALPRARAPGARRPSDGEPALFLSKSGRRLSTSDVRRRLRVWARARRACTAASPRTRCATRSRPTCSTAAPTCARSRSCSGHASHLARRRSTLG